MLAKNILLLNGPNLNLVGARKPHINGFETLADVEASSLGASLVSYQTNHEGNMLDRIHDARLEGIDAFDVHKSEAFRYKSYVSDKAEAVICWLGIFGYKAAVEWCVACLKDKLKA